MRAKPDLVAPGVGIESLSDPGSAMYSARSSAYLLAGTVATRLSPYLSLSGTSMARRWSAARVALMLQANPALTPNAVKAILQYTAQIYPGYDALTEGAGFLNAAGAVTLARYFGGRPEPARSQLEPATHLGESPSVRRPSRPHGECLVSRRQWGAATAGTANCRLGRARRVRPVGSHVGELGRRAAPTAAAVSLGAARTPRMWSGVRAATAPIAAAARSGRCPASRVEHLERD